MSGPVRDAYGSYGFGIAEGTPTGAADRAGERVLATESGYREVHAIGQKSAGHGHREGGLGRGGARRYRTPFDPRGDSIGERNCRPVGYLCAERMHDVVASR